MGEKITIAMITNQFDITGISTVILNYCKRLDHSKFNLTVIAGSPISDQNRMDCNEHGIEFIELPSRHQKPCSHYYQTWKVLKKNKYDIVHIHGSSSMMAIELTIAKLAGIKKRIAHSHNSECPNMRVHRILNPYFRKIYTKALACGVLAGDWLYGPNRFEILPNGFHTEKFIFDGKEREIIRKELHIENKFVIGHIGRFNKQKNQTYLLQVFERLAAKRPDAILLLVGTGPDFDKTQTMVKSSPYRDRIVLYGVTKNTLAMYSAMDVFALPSRHEGLPVVLLEAQISGLPCIVSDKVTREVDFGNIIWESIECDPEIWAQKIGSIDIVNESERENYYMVHRKQIAEYDIENTAKQLDRIYESLTEKGK